MRFVEATASLLEKFLANLKTNRVLDLFDPSTVALVGLLPKYWLNWKVAVDFMRIAVSGAHSQGSYPCMTGLRVTRSTSGRRSFAPCMLSYDIRFRQECHRFDNGLQMYYNISRVNAYSDSTECVIFDRCPIDYIAHCSTR